MKKLVLIILLAILLAPTQFVQARIGKNPCSGRWVEAHPRLKEECLHNLKFIDKRFDKGNIQVNSDQPMPIFCGNAPDTWVDYWVQEYDTLSEIAENHFITIEELMYANCLTSNALYVGQVILVPGIVNYPPGPTPYPEPEVPPNPYP